jgi:hypothetical protein
MEMACRPLHSSGKVMFVMLENLLRNISTIVGGTRGLISDRRSYSLLMYLRKFAGIIRSCRGSDSSILMNRYSLA